MVEIDDKQIFSIIQKAKESGKLRIGVNEVTKAIERGVAKLVVYASDVNPAQIVAHIPGLCKEMKILQIQMGTRAELGAAVSIKNTTAIAILDAGSGKKELDALLKDTKEEKKKEEKAVEEAPKAEE
jgi:large subunit ribosomal protein L7Ae